MKKIAGCLAVLALIQAMNWAGRYTLKQCEVVDVRGEVVTVEDLCGNLWAVEADGFRVGDSVELKMNGKGTDFIEDDEVLDIMEA